MKTRIVSRTAMFAALALGMIGTTVATAAPRCQSLAEIRAMQMRQFQIDLMVATLKCDGGGDFRTPYATFMRHVHPLMAGNARTLRAMFARRGQRPGALDHYLTRLSNQAQLASGQTADFCGAQAHLMTEAAALPTPRLPRLAADVVGIPFDSHACAARR